MVGVVGIGMVADDMSFGNHPISDIGVKLNIFTDNEKGSFDVIFIKDIQYLFGIYPIGSIVKGKGDHSIIGTAFEIDLAEDR